MGTDFATNPVWKAAVIAGGVGQVFTALIYPYIRHAVFDWYRDVQKLKPLNRQIAYTYGRYIQGLNFAFGLIAILLPAELLGGTPLAVAMTGLIAAYWIGKVVTQGLHYPMYEIPNRAVFRVGEVGMNALFLYFAGLYAVLVAVNVRGLVA